jgi:hypothetical protein
VPVWSVLVLTEVRFPESGDDDSWEALSALVDAVLADERALGASVAGQGPAEGASVFLSVDCASADEAKTVCEDVVARALGELELPSAARAAQVYDEQGNFIAVTD